MAPFPSTHRTFHSITQTCEDFLTPYVTSARSSQAERVEFCISKRYNSTRSIIPFTFKFTIAITDYWPFIEGGFFCRGWSEEWMVLYEDSTMAWYADKGLSRPRGCIRISDAPELLAVGEWTQNVPRKPRFPRGCHVRQLIVVGETSQKVHWLMAQSPAEVK